VQSVKFIKMEQRLCKQVDGIKASNSARTDGVTPMSLQELVNALLTHVAFAEPFAILRVNLRIL